MFVCLIFHVCFTRVYHSLSLVAALTCVDPCDPWSNLTLILCPLSSAPPPWPPPSHSDLTTPQTQWPFKAATFEELDWKCLFAFYLFILLIYLFFLGGGESCGSKMSESEWVSEWVSLLKLSPHCKVHQIFLFFFPALKKKEQYSEFTQRIFFFFSTRDRRKIL